MPVTKMVALVVRPGARAAQDAERALLAALASREPGELTARSLLRAGS